MADAVRIRVSTSTVVGPTEGMPEYALYKIGKGKPNLLLTPIGDTQRRHKLLKKNPIERNSSPVNDNFNLFG